ncbi:MAG: S1C family serine protease [Vitreoscilla sp.]
MISLRILATLAMTSGLCVAATAASNDTAFPEAAAAPTEAERPPTFEFARMRSKLVGGDKIGWIESGLFCTHRANAGANVKIEDVATNQGGAAYKLEAAALGLHSAAPEISSFDASPAKSDPDYRIGGVLQAMNMAECRDGNDRKGDFSVTVKWEVFAPKLQKVVFSAVTTGSIHTDSFSAVAGRDFEIKAYADSLHRMLTDPGFTALKAVPGAAAAPAAGTVPTLAPLHLKSASTLAGSTQVNAAALRNAAATVMHDNVSGSAFYVADGYLLTNHHVVGTAHYVKVKLASGQVLVGEVLRDDAHRDVALIKTEPAGVTPLHVNMAEPAVGSDVFAIGSPLGQELAGTFTRGVLSGTRAHDGLEYLQSDAAVNPGNSGGPLLDGSSSVIGMTVLKINQAAGLSFFIPIRDAANALQLIFD